MCELKPCPICGSEVHISASSDGYGVECASDGCFALAMDRFLTPELAARYWNTRDERYMELPVDADGVPIRVGDEINSLGCGVLVNSIIWDGTNWYVSETVSSSDWFPVKHSEHVKPRTLEDVLRDMEGMRGNNATYEDVVRRCAELAAELRELMVVA